MPTSPHVPDVRRVDEKMACVSIFIRTKVRVGCETLFFAGVRKHTSYIRVHHVVTFKHRSAFQRVKPYGVAQTKGFAHAAMINSNSNNSRYTLTKQGLRRNCMGAVTKSSAFVVLQCEIQKLPKLKFEN